MIILNPFDVDIWTAKVDGGITLSGTNAFTRVEICGNDVKGNSSFSNFTLTGNIGGGTPYGIPCGGNIFHGSVSLTNLTVTMGGNTIKGDLLCTNSTVIVTARKAFYPRVGKNLPNGSRRDVSGKSPGLGTRR